MSDVARQISAALCDVEEDQYREQHRRALEVLRTIPSGTPDEALTPQQRQAWLDHDEAVEWLQSREDNDAE